MTHHDYSGPIKLDTRNRGGVVVRNNVISFLMTVAISVITFMLYLIPNYIYRFNQHSKSQLVFFVPLLAITLMLFVAAGRYVLRDTGSPVKNVLSLVLPFVVGILITLIPINGVNPLELYFAYSVPLTGIAVLLNFVQGFFSTGIAPGVTFSVIPSLLFLLGLQWQSRLRKHL